MSRQNTQKQILAMVLLMFFGVASLGAYVWFDDGRRPEAEDQQLIGSAERGARLFANNCRVCHGNAGQGLIGPALNTPGNTLAFRSHNDGAFSELQGRLTATIECGRNGTAMPPWAVANGGSLNFFHIESLITLITTNSGNAWEEALALAIEKDGAALRGLQTALADSQAGATAEGIAAAVNAALDTAGGDATAALAAAVLQLRGAGIATQIDAEFTEAYDAAAAAGDDETVAKIDAQILARESELLDQAVSEALAETSNDALRALTRARAALAERAATNAQDTLDQAVANVEAGRPIQQATPSLTQGTCGQRIPG